MVASIGAAIASAIAAAAAAGDAAEGLSGNANAGIVSGVVINDSGPPSATNSQMADGSGAATGGAPSRLGAGAPDGPPPT
jgi:hypothetical protein